MKITNNTNNKKGAKMRKYILPLLVAGAVAFTASQAMAAIYSNKTFSEDTSTGSHYKEADSIETGAGNYQLNSAVIKELLVGGSADGDESFGYVTGLNPFTAGYAGGPLDSLGNTDDTILVAPAYTEPCPHFYANCDANAFATDPQSEASENVWDGVVLDDLFQATGQVDSSDGIVGGVWVEDHKSLDQSLDAVFFLGKPAEHGITVLNGTTDVTPVAGSGRFFNIDQTLDQDVADWSITYTGTNNLSAKEETMGIYGKLTQLFQLAGSVSSEEGCASKGAGGTLGMDSAVSGNACTPFVTTWSDPIQYNGVDAGNDNENSLNTLNALQVMQYMVSDVYDWGHVSDTSDKEAGNGIKQNYASFFEDGSGQDYNYEKAIDLGHSKNSLTTGQNTTHTHPDP